MPGTPACAVETETILPICLYPNSREDGAAGARRPGNYRGVQARWGISPRPSPAMRAGFGHYLKCVRDIALTLNPLQMGEGIMR